MQNTTNRWKELYGCISGDNTPILTPKSTVRIKWNVSGDITGMGVPIVTARSASAESVLTDIGNGEEKYYQNNIISLEHNSWGLNGEYSHLSDDYARGYICSILSKSDCTYNESQAPKLTLEYNANSGAMTGITITWSKTTKQYARAFTVYFYNNNSLIHNTTITNNTSVVSVVEEQVSNCNKIIIQINKWCLPYCRARIEDVELGLIQDIQGSQLFDYTHTMSGDRCSFILPQNSIQFTVDNIKGQWNPDNPIGLYQYLTDRQIVDVFYSLNVDGEEEYIKGGSFIITSVDTYGIQAVFTAQSWLSVMDELFDTTNVLSSCNLYYLCEKAFIQANLPTKKDGSERYHIDDTLESISVTIPQNFDKYTQAEVIQLIANASGKIIRIDRDGDIWIEAEGDTVTDYVVNSNVSFSDINYTLTDSIYKVRVNDRLWDVGGTQGVIQKVNNPLIQSNGRGLEIARKVYSVLSPRKVLSCSDFHSDVRLDIYDKITISTKFSTNTVSIDSIVYRYNGAFRGEIEGRAVVV